MKLPSSPPSAGRPSLSLPCIQLAEGPCQEASLLWIGAAPRFHALPWGCRREQAAQREDSLRSSGWQRFLGDSQPTGRRLLWGPLKSVGLQGLGVPLSLIKGSPRTPREPQNRSRDGGSGLKRTWDGRSSESASGVARLVCRFYRRIAATSLGDLGTVPVFPTTWLPTLTFSWII